MAVDERRLSEGQRAYEARRAAKAGMSLERWLHSRERERADAAKAAAPVEPPRAPGRARAFLGRLMERAQRPLK